MYERDVLARCNILTAFIEDLDLVAYTHAHAVTLREDAFKFQGDAVRETMKSRIRGNEQTVYSLWTREKVQTSGWSWCEYNQH